MRTRAIGVGLAVLAGVVLASCGGGDDRLTQAELAARGDGVCRKLATDVQKLASEFDSAIIFPPEQMQALYTKMVPLVDGAIADFKGLEPPKDLEAKYQAALAQSDTDRKALVAGTKSPEAAKKLFDSQVDPFRSTNEKLAGVGITACSDGTAQGDGDGAGTTDTTAATTETTAATTDTTAATSTTGP